MVKVTQTIREHSIIGGDILFALLITNIAILEGLTDKIMNYWLIHDLNYYYKFEYKISF